LVSISWFLKFFGSSGACMGSGLTFKVLNTYIKSFGDLSRHRKEL